VGAQRSGRGAPSRIDKRTSHVSDRLRTAEYPWNSNIISPEHESRGPRVEGGSCLGGGFRGTQDSRFLVGRPNLIREALITGMVVLGFGPWTAF
jgi:hypothetical protein